MKATVTKVTKRIDNTINKTEGIVNYDIDNAYPQRLKDIVNNSGSASGCVKMKARFLMGGGFEDEFFYKQKVNKHGLTVDKLLRKICNNMSLLPFVGVHVNYNALYKTSEVNYVPFENMRLTTCDHKKHPNMIAIYDDWQKTKGAIKWDKVDYINLYNPDTEVIDQEVIEAGGWGNYKGQIHLYSPEGFEYPLADYDSVLEDMQTDGKAKTFKFRNITTNFMASHLLITDKIEDVDGQTPREDFIAGLEDFQGSDDALKIMHLEKASTESTIELKKVEIQDVDKLYEFTEKSVKDNIMFSFLQPPVLLVQTAGKLGTSTEIKDATSYYNGITYHERLIIEEMFETVFSNFYYDINPSKNYAIKPFIAPVSKKELTQEYFPYVTKNQILASIGEPEVDTPLADTKPLYESLGVGGLQSLSALLADKLILPEQKKNILMIVFKLNEADATKLSGGGAPVL